MIELAPVIQQEYDRWNTLIGDSDPYVGRHCLGIKDVLKAHYLIANKFYVEQAGMGGIGPMSLDKLHSVMGRQHVGFEGKTKWTDKFDICATLMYGLTKGHAFHNANKRTAFLCALYQMQNCGWSPTASEKEFEDLTVYVADDQLDRFARYNRFVTNGDPDPAVKFISHFLRKNMRQLDRRSRVITFQELQTILTRHGCRLANQRDNHIDIMRIERRTSLFGLGKTREHPVRLGQIGFPRWTAQVSQSALKTVREVTKLTYEQGVDSASFFEGIDPMQELITSYHEPLLRLADR